MKTLTIIPSRLSATRLPGKPLLKINGLSIISHVFRKAQEANIGEVVVATEDQEILDDVIQNGGRAIITSNNHKTGTDRIYEALKKIDLKSLFKTSIGNVYHFTDVSLYLLPHKKLKFYHDRFVEMGPAIKYGGDGHSHKLPNSEAGDIKNLDLNSIKIITSTGSPLAEESFKYVYDNIKKDVHLASIAGGTDLVGCLVLGNLFSNVHKGEIQGQSLGIDVDVFTDDGNSTPHSCISS